ncbi:MAG: sialidase family protein [Planctomycetota bacterium]
MKITPLLITVAALAAPLSAQSRGGDTMVDSGATAAWGTVVGAHDLNAVAVWNSDDTVFASNSKDGGRNWIATPVVIGGATGSGDKRTYKDAIAFANGNVYLAYEDKATGSDEHMFSMSSDGGDTWSTPTTIPSAGAGYITDIDVHANGQVIVVVSLALAFPNGCFVNVSNDQGATWTETRVDAALGDVDGIDASMSGNDLLVTFNDDSTTLNQTYAVVSNDGGMTFGPIVTLSAGGAGKTAYPVCYTENGDMVVAWIEDDSSLSGTYEDVMASYSTDHGATWGPAMNLTNNAGAFDCDNLEVYHSQLNAGTGGMTNFVFENNTSGSDEVFCMSTDDYGVNFSTTNFGSGSYPRVAGKRSYVGIAYGSGSGSPEQSVLAVSRDGGITFRASADVSQGAATGDADYTEIALDTVYDNFIVGSLEDRTGQNQMYVGGSRTALLNAVVDTTAHTVQFDISGVGVQASATQVQLVASSSVTTGSAIVPDGRDALLYVDPILLITRSYAPFRVAIDAMGNGSTALISIPAGYYGATLQFAGLEILSGGMFGTLIEPVAVIL